MRWTSGGNRWRWVLVLALWAGLGSVCWSQASSKPVGPQSLEEARVLLPDLAACSVLERMPNQWEWARIQELMTATVTWWQQHKLDDEKTWQSLSDYEAKEQAWKAKETAYVQKEIAWQEDLMKLSEQQLEREAQALSLTESLVGDNRRLEAEKTWGTVLGAIGGVLSGIGLDRILVYAGLR